MRFGFAALMGVALIVASGCSSSGDATTSTSAMTTTSAAPSTTSAETTSTTATTTTASTTTTTAATTTTTLAPTTTGAGDGVALSDEGLQAGDAWVPFGTLETDAVAAVTAVLGAPTDDSGWVDAFSAYGTCPAPVVRGVHWDAFVMLFTEADTDFWTAGVPHFFAWYYTSVPPDLATTEGLRIGDTLQDLDDRYGGPSLVIDEDPFDPTAGYWAYDLVGWTGIWGFADGTDPSSTITSINGGRGCGE